MNLATSATHICDHNSRLDAKARSVFSLQDSPQAGSLRRLFFNWREAGVEPQNVVAILPVV